MSNFFAALDDSGDEAEIPRKTTKVTKKKETLKTAVVEPSKPERRRQKHDDRNTKSGRGRPQAREGKRSYDRRSGTGRGKEIKKGGGGGRNWGSDKNDARRNQGAVDEKALNEKEADGAEKTVEGEETKEEEKVEVKEEEPEDNTMSYEDYMKSKENPAAGILAPVEKKDFVNEFAGKETHAVKKDEEFLVMGSGKAIRKKGAKKEEKKTLTPSFRVADPNKRGGRDERGGRDRRGGGGGRDRRGGRGGGRKAKPAPGINTSDTDAFPTL